MYPPSEIVQSTGSHVLAALLRYPQCHKALDDLLMEILSVSLI